MKQGRPLPDLVQEIARQAQAKRDFLAPVRHLHVRTNGSPALIVGGAGRFALTEIAHSQIAEYAGIPKPFYDRLKNDPSLVVDTVDGYAEANGEERLFDLTVNTLLRAKPADKRLVRTLDGNARAFLSERYTTDLDHYDLLKLLLPLLQSGPYGELQVLSSEVTERKLYLKVVSPKVQATVHPENLERPHGGHHFLREPQVIQAGFIAANSEVGLGGLSIEQVAYSLMCTNLWIAERTYRTRHVGAALSADENGEVYRDDTRRLDAQARLLKARDHIAAALDETRFQALAARMQESAQVRIEGRVEKVVEVTARRFGLTDEERERTLRSFVENAPQNGWTLWGLSNAITDIAGQAESFDRATELEAIGGRFFSLPDSEVKELVLAA